MKFISMFIIFLLTFQSFAQEVKKRNLTKKKYFYYDASKFDVESEGYFYKDDLGETTLRHGLWRFYDREGTLLEERNYYKNNIHGQVKTYYGNGIVASEGYFLNGVQDSVYLENYESGKPKQIGNYKEGKPIGKWTYFYLDGRKKMVEEIKNGTSYVWEFYLPDSLNSATVIDGNGEMIDHYSNGNLKSFYTYENGLKSGPFEEGSVYGYFLMKGAFDAGSPSGEWIYFYYSGDIEKVVNYKNGKLDGAYKYYYDNGQVNVEGQYLAGEKSGEWTWFTNTGKVDMKGHFVEGKQHGDWVYNYPTGELSYKAYFEEGKREGTWEYFYKDGSKFKVGVFENDAKNGLWQTWYESGVLLMKGSYEKDKEEGEWLNYWDNGKLKNKTTFKQGKKHGEWVSHYPNGTLKLIGEYDLELKTGEWKHFFENGKIRDVESFKVIDRKSKVKHGSLKGRTHRVSVRHGNFVSYSAKDYQKTQEGKYKNDQKDGEWIAYFPGGKRPAVVTTYSKGELNGPLRTYAQRGNRLLSEVNYKNGLQHGKAIVYDKRGKVAKEEEYKNGQKVVQGVSFSPR